jgi:AcrR family transcriptional regulator
MNLRKTVRTSNARSMEAVGSPNRSSRYDEKQRAILRAATITFNQKGVRGANLSAIARAVGLTTASITYYYKKKEELAAACFLLGIATYETINRAPVDLASAKDRFTALVERHFQLRREIALGRHDPPILFDEIRALSGSGSVLVVSAYVDMFRQLRRLLFRDHSSSALSGSDRNARTHLVLGCLLWLPAWVMHRDTDDYMFDATHFSDLLANGLAADSWQPNRVAPAVSIPIRDASPREAFLRAATYLINEHGYHGASVDKISAQLNVSKGSFYHHNETKDGLVIECFERTIGIIRQAQSEGRSLRSSGLDRLRATCAALAEFQMSKSGPLLRSTALLALPETSRRQMIARMNRLSSRFADMITDGIIDGSIRRVDAQIGGQLINPMINGAAELQHWAPGVTAGTVTQVYVDPLLRGLFRETGSQPALLALNRRVP